MRLGIDIGGTKTAALVPSTRRRGRRPRRGSLRVRGKTQVLATAVRRRRPRRASSAGGRPSTTSSASHARARRPARPGWARHAVNLGAQALDLAGGIEAATGGGGPIDNDVKAAALGAHHAVRPDGVRRHDGLPQRRHRPRGAIVRGGQVVRGAGGAAGEIGHIPVGTGVPCSCGQQGCLETIASGTALHACGRRGRPPETSSRGRRGRRAGDRRARPGPTASRRRPAARGHRGRGRRHRRRPGRDRDPRSRRPSPPNPERLGRAHRSCASARPRVARAGAPARIPGGRRRAPPLGRSSTDGGRRQSSPRGHRRAPPRTRSSSRTARGPAPCSGWPPGPRRSGSTAASGGPSPRDGADFSAARLRARRVRRPPAGHPEGYREVMMREVFEPSGSRPSWSRAQRRTRRRSRPRAPTTRPRSASRRGRPAGPRHRPNGHIGFNEPGSALNSRTRVKTLTEPTRSDNARFFTRPTTCRRTASPRASAPSCARRLVLVATGDAKAEAVAAALEGPLTASVPARCSSGIRTRPWSSTRRRRPSW